MKVEDVKVKVNGIDADILGWVKPNGTTVWVKVKMSGVYRMDVKNGLECKKRSKVQFSEGLKELQEIAKAEGRLF